MKYEKSEKKEKRELRVIAFSQIFLLVVATIAFSWMIGGEIETVSAAAGDCLVPCGACSNVDKNVYWGCADTGTCINNGTLLLTCTGGQTCSGGVCVDAPDGGDDDGKDGVTLGDAASTILSTTSVLANGDELFEEVKTTGTKVVNGIKNVLTGSKTGTVSSTGIGGINSPLYTGALPGGPTSIPGGSGLPGGAMPSSAMHIGTTATVIQVLINAAAAAATALVINYFAKKFASDRNFNDIKTITWLSVAPAAGIGLLAGSLGLGAIFAAGVVALAFGLYMLFGYQLYSREIYNYRVSMWQAPVGGNDCNRCNDLTLGTGNNKVSGCSEYICHSYGAACMWLNDNTEYETCTVGNPNDGAAPVIRPAREIYGEEVFPTSQYDYKTSATSARIVYNGSGGGANQCIPAYTPIKIALTTQEEAYCKISLEQTNGTPQNAFSNMLPMAEGSVYTKNHTVQLPSSVSATQQALDSAGYSINNGGNYRFYVRCSDAWGNINSVDYSVQFCVQMGPDRRPPVVIETNPATESYIKAGTAYIEDFQVYTNEPADCKWDTRRVNYNYMSYNFSRCSQRVDDYIAGFDYGCRTNLTQFTNAAENRYYIACRDNPQYKGNVTTEAQRNTGTPYEVVLIGTSRLMIQSVRINSRQNGTIIRTPYESAAVKLEVFTTNGAEDGRAKCLYSINSKDENSYSLFTNEGIIDYLTTNTEELYMPEGVYTANIKCLDLAENVAETMINFTVEIDTLSPAIVRVYKDETSDSLKIITDEIAECVYSTTTCAYNIEDGTSIETNDGTNHYIEWDVSRDLYIKCTDEYENSPPEGSCSIIVRPFEVAQVI